MTLDATELEQLAVRVRAVVARVAAAFGAGSVDNTAVDAVDAPALEAPTAGASTYDGWSYLVRLPVPPDAVERLDGPVRELLVAEGLEEVDRDSETEIARQFRSPTLDVGVQLARSGRGELVIGGSATAR